MRRHRPSVTVESPTTGECRLRGESHRGISISGQPDDLALAGVPGPDDRVPSLLWLGAEPVVEDSLVIGLKIREPSPSSGRTFLTLKYRAMATQARRPIPGERREKRLPLAQQGSRLSSRQNRSGKGERLADQRANIVPAASGKPQRLRRYRLQPLPQSARIGVDLRWPRAKQPRGRLYCRDLVALLSWHRFACSIKGIRSARVVREGGVEGHEMVS